MKEVFNVLGSIVSGSGFEDIIFQANTYSTGSLNGVLAGSHYNRCWAVHSNFEEALERLLFKRFLSVYDKSDIIKQLVGRTSVCSEELTKLLDNTDVIKLLEDYGYFKNCVRNGHPSFLKRRTPQEQAEHPQEHSMNTP